MHRPKAGKSSAATTLAGVGAGRSGNAVIIPNMGDLATISFVYFDLGGVVICDFSGTNKWVELKNELGITPEKYQEFEDFWKKYEAEACIGRDVETLLPLMEEKFGIQVPNNYSLLLNGFVDRFEVNKFIWPAVNEIHKNCRVGLLTNMYPGMYAAIEKRNLLPDVVWDVVLDSSVVGLQKPDSKMFQLAEEKTGSKGRKILYVENNPSNVKAAQAFGWQTFLYDPTHPDKSSQEVLELWHTLRK